MATRALIGMAGGGTLGGLYGVFGRCLHGVCAVNWNPWVPLVIGSAVGLGIVFVSRWD